MKTRLLLLTGFAIAAHFSASAQCTPPTTPTATGDTVNCGSSATITASGSTGTYMWYDQPTGGNLLGTGASLNTPPVVANTNFYVEASSQTPPTMMAHNNHTSNFTGNVRGYFFTAPVDFTIVGLKTPPEITGNQSIAVVRFTAGPPPLFSATTNSFTVLYLTQNNPSTAILPVNIPVAQGDIIGILGQAGTTNSYTAGPVNTTIGGQPVTLARMGMQFPLTTTAPQQLWTENGGSISRVEMYYTTGCSSPRAMTTVVVDPLQITATASATTVCDGDQVTLTGSGATTYVWSSGGTAAVEIVNPSTTTTYTVLGNDPNGCSGSTTVTVNVNALPNINVTAASGLICEGSADTLTASGGVSYAWSSGGTTATEIVMPTTNTTYTVTGTDANGCTSTSAITVNVNPSPAITALTLDTTVCDGSAATLIADGGLSYLWNNNNTNDTIVVNPIGTTTYTVTGTDANGCSNTATVTVLTNALPTVDLGSDVNQCGSSATLDAGPAGVTYVWSSGGTAQTEVVTADGSYNVTVTDVNGCSNSDTINVTLLANPVVNLGNDGSVCGNVVLDAQNQGSTYIWNDNSSGQTLNVTTSGTYYVTVINSDGCTSSDTIALTVNANPTTTASASSTTVCLDDANVTLSGTPAGGTFSGPGVSGNSFDPSIGIGAQTVVYTFTDNNGCTGTSTVVVNVNACVGIAENATSSFGVYPNPTDGLLNVVFHTAAEEAVIVVTDVAGKVVMTQQLNGVQSGSVAGINLSNEAAGIYFVRVQAGTASSVQKIQVVK